MREDHYPRGCWSDSRIKLIATTGADELAISRRERSSSGTARASWPCGVRSMRDAGSLPA